MSDEQKSKAIKWAQVMARRNHTKPTPDSSLIDDALDAMDAKDLRTLIRETIRESEKEIRALQQWVKENQRAAAEAREQCETETRQLRRYVEGFTAGMAARKEVKVVEKITQKPHTKPTEVTVHPKRYHADLPDLAPPVPLEQIQEQIQQAR